MLSPADMLLIGAAALIFFGPDQLPKVAKRAGQVVREVQNTSQSFIREMERAADDVERRERYAAEQAAVVPASPVVPEPESATRHDLVAHAEHADSGPIEIIEAEPKPCAPEASATKSSD